MSRSRDRRKKRERETWARRKIHLRIVQSWSSRYYAPVVACDECHGSGRAPDHARRDVFGSDGPIGRFQMCRKCWGDGKVRDGMFEVKVTP